MIRHWVPERPIVLVADSSFAAAELLAAARRHKFCVIARLRLDAALYEPPRSVRRGGRPRRRGAPQPTLKTISTSETTTWRGVTLSQSYGQGDKAVKIATGTAVCYNKSLPTVSLRRVLVRDPQRKLDPQAFPARTMPSNLNRSWPSSSAAGRSKLLSKRHVRIWARKHNDNAPTVLSRAPHP